jgi:hypothetical protein
MLTSLSEGKVAEVVGAFDEDFTFTDHALGLEFKDKGRLMKFLQRSREVFPDTVIKVVSAFTSGEHATAEWELTAKQRVPSAQSSPNCPFQCTVYPSWKLRAKRSRVGQTTMTLWSPAGGVWALGL